jgi:hypothetical protein
LRDLRVECTRVQQLKATKESSEEQNAKRSKSNNRAERFSSAPRAAVMRTVGCPPQRRIQLDDLVGKEPQAHDIITESSTVRRVVPRLYAFGMF